MDAIPINGLDLTVIIVLLISGLLAFMRGFVHEILSIGAWVGAALAALYGMPYAQPTARGLIPFDWAADAAAFVVIFLVVLFALSIITNMMSKTIQASALNNLDRSLGFVFGLIRAGVILGVLLIISDWLMTADSRPDWMRRAKTLPVIEAVADGLRRLVPDTFMAAEDAAKDAAGKAQEALELKRQYDRLTAPATGPDQAPAEKPGYQDSERRQLERLMENNKGRPQ